MALFDSVYHIPVDKHSHKPLELPSITPARISAKPAVLKDFPRPCDALMNGATKITEQPRAKGDATDISPYQNATDSEKQ